jgi:hypothetical protein
MCPLDFKIMAFSKVDGRSGCYFKGTSLCAGDFLLGFFSNYYNEEEKVISLIFLRGILGGD